MLKLTVPMSPSVNQKFISRSYVVSSKYRNFKKDIQSLLTAKKVKQIDGKICLTTIFYFARERDIDSGVKALLDSFNAIVWADDKDVLIHHSLKYFKCKEPRIEVIAEWTPFSGLEGDTPPENQWLFPF